MKKRLLSILLAAVMLLSAVPLGMIDTAYAAGVTASGTCGDNGNNVMWTLTSDGTLTISGKGDMTDYDPPEMGAPWPQAAVKKVLVGSGVTSIGVSAFENCSNLTSVTIPRSVTWIYPRAFYGCKSLTSITIPSGVTEICYSLFEGCSSLKSVTIPDGVTSIDSNAFRNCTGLTSVTIPGSVTESGWSVFDGCSKLKDIYYDGYILGWEKLGIDAPKTATIHFKADDVYGRGSCGANLTWVMALDGTMTISGTGSMKNYVDDPGEQAPWCGDQLKKAVIKSGVTSIGNYAFYLCQYVTSVTIPSSVTSIGKWAFHNCDSLTSVTIPDGVTSIGENTFGNCFELTSVTIPKSVTSIGSKAFDYCYSLTDVYYAGTAADWAKIKISSDGNEDLSNATLHCAAAALTAPVVKIGANSSGKPVLKWDAVPGAAQYEVWRSTTGKSGSYSIVRRTAALTYTDETAAAGSMYYYVVRAKSGATYSKYSAAQKITCKAPVLTAPTVTASTNSSGKPVLSWTKVPGAAQYEVWRSATGKAGSYSIVRRTATLTYTDEKAALGSTYYYVVRAMSGTVYSKYSAAQKITCKVTALAAPAVKSGTSAAGKPVLSWAKVPGAAQYEVWRSATGKAGSYSIVRRTATLTYTDETAAFGSTYYYVVRAMNGTIYSKYSAAQKVMSLAAPAVTASTNANGKPVLSWAKLPGAAQYEVWRSTTGSAGSYSIVRRTAALTYTDDKATAGTTYYYRVRALHDTITGTFSGAVRIAAK